MKQSKQSVANQIFAENSSSETRANMIKMIMEQTGASMAHASTLYQTAKKKAGDEIPGEAPFVVYDRETTLYMRNRKPNGIYVDSYKTVSAARAAMTRLLSKGKIESLDDYAIAGAAYFRENIEKQETKKNLMSGKEFTQPVNTPIYCDPSSETYWSM